MANVIFKYAAVMAGLLSCVMVAASEPEHEICRLEPVSGNHPRILLDDMEFASVMKEVESGQNPVLSMLHSEIMYMADNAGMSSEPLTFTLDVSGRRILDVSRNALMRIFSCAYAYRYTGEKRYLEHAEKDLADVCSFESWNAGRHFLDAGEMAAAVGLGYDWLYGHLSRETLDKCESAVVQYAFRPAMEGIWNLDFYSAGSNWNQVCNGGLAVAALAVYETCPDMANHIIEKAVASNRVAMEAMYSPDGNYPEGPGYWGYGTNYEVLMLGALESVYCTDFGLPSVPGFDRTGLYRLFCYTPTERQFCYGDNLERGGPEYAMWYLAWKFNEPSLLWKELQYLKAGNYGHGNSSGRFLPMLMAFASKIDFRTISPPSQKYYCGQGKVPVMIVRTGWSPNDSYLGFKGGYARSSHSHLDAGEFYYEADGVRWSMDYERQSYQSVENTIRSLGGSFWDTDNGSFRWMGFRMHNRQHSTLTLNDKEHLVDGKATIVEEFRSGDAPGATMDLSPVFMTEAETVVRTVRLVNGRILTITDKVKAYDDKDVAVRWTMVTEGRPEVDSDCIILVKGDRKMRLHADASETEVHYREWSSDPADYDTPLTVCDEPNPGTYIVGFEATVARGACAEFKVTLSPVP